MTVHRSSVQDCSEIFESIGPTTTPSPARTFSDSTGHVTSTNGVTPRGDYKQRGLLQTMKSIEGSLISDESFSCELPDGEANSTNDESEDHFDKDRIVRNVTITGQRCHSSLIINKSVKEKIKKEVKWIDLNKKSTSLDQP